MGAPERRNLVANNIDQLGDGGRTRFARWKAST